MSESTTEVWKEFSENEITHSAAHHLLAIYELHAKRGYSRVTDVAKFLEITTGSASTNLKNLKNKGLIKEDENRFLILTDQGEKLTKVILEKRKILEQFFTKVLGVSKDQSSIDACKTEHLISDETTSKMAEYANKL